MTRSESGTTQPSVYPLAWSDSLRRTKSAPTGAARDMAVLWLGSHGWHFDRDVGWTHPAVERTGCSFVGACRHEATRQVQRALEPLGYTMTSGMRTRDGSWAELSSVKSSRYPWPHAVTVALRREGLIAPPVPRRARRHRRTGRQAA